MSNRNRLIVLAALVLVGLFVWQFFTASSTPDQVLIERAVDESIKASREGRPGGVLELLSQSFEVEGLPGAFERSEIATAVRNYKPHVELGSKVASVHGDRATIETSIRLSAPAPLNLSLDIPEAKLEFVKEPTTRWLVIPDKKWRLVKVTLPRETAESLLR